MSPLDVPVGLVGVGLLGALIGYVVFAGVAELVSRWRRG